MQLSSIVNLPPHLAKDMPYAIEARLHGVVPISGDSWPEDVCDGFGEKSMADSCAVTVTSRSPDGTLTVLVDVNGENLSDYLIQGNKFCCASMRTRLMKGISVYMAAICDIIYFRWLR